jgi:cell division initiation protein
METLVREVMELREFRQTYDERVRELTAKEETVKNTLLMTQKLVEDLKENARKEGSLIIKDAEVRSQQIVGGSQQEKVALEADILNPAQASLQDIKKVIQMHLEMVCFEEYEEVKEEPAQG